VHGPKPLPLGGGKWKMRGNSTRCRLHHGWATPRARGDAYTIYTGPTSASRHCLIRFIFLFLIALDTGRHALGEARGNQI
jgi:hypothetical protein